MKKIISLMFAMLMFVGIASAQTVEHGKLFNNTYVSVDGGIFTPLKLAKDNTINPTFGVEFGKNITPVIGVSLEGQMYPSFANKNLKLTNVVGNFKINLSNWFGGYNGEPRTVEFVLVPGIGWMHDFANDNFPVAKYDPNYITYNTGAEVNFNLGKEKAWQINVKPDVVWNEIIGMGFYPNYADWRLTCGVTYKFGYKNASGKKTHNFTVVTDKVDENDYNNLYTKYNELLNATKTVDTVVVEKVVEVVNNASANYTSRIVVSFDKGSSTLSNNEKANIEEFVKSLPNGYGVKVIGSADSKTGSMNINEKLSSERANNVANTLKNLGVKDVEVETTLDINQDAESSRCAIIVVID
jgi:outer membrane protein OmpA-like peptidoglycan-associated protein